MTMMQLPKRIAKRRPNLSDTNGTKGNEAIDPSE